MTKSFVFDMPLLPHLVIDGLNRYKSRPFMYIGDIEVSYADVLTETSRFVQAMQSRGIGLGSRAAVISSNRPEVLYNMTTNMMLGVCSTPLHPLGSVVDHAYILKDAETEVLVYDTVFEEQAKELKEKVPTLKHLFAFGDTEVGENLVSLAEQFEPQPLVAPNVRPNDLNMLIYTGGTTGRSKGVRQAYRAAAYMTMVQMAEWEWPEEIRFLIATPLSHAGAAFFVPTLQLGGSFVVMQGFTPDLFFDTVEKYKITTTFLVPVMIYTLLSHPRATTADLSSLETLFYGASPMNPARLAEGLEKWGPIFAQFFGQSEAPMVLTYMKKNEHDLTKPEHLSSCGRPTPWVPLDLLDEHGQSVKVGESGEICVRGPLCMEGYHHLPEQTAETLVGDWLHTGDVGKFDDDGFLYIVDRKKDMVVTGGFNVFPREVEDVISTHPAVAQVAVVGVPDENWGEAVKAVVVLRSGYEGDDALVKELQTLVKEAKGSVQAPKSIDIVDALPLSPLGKPDKKTLRERYWGTQERRVH